MNGEEFVIKQPPGVSPLNTYGQVPELNASEKMDLTVFGATPTAKLLFKLMEIIVVRARNDAMRCPPDNRDKRISLLDIATAKDDFYKELRGEIEIATQEHILDIRIKAQQEELKDQAKLEEIILFNSTGHKSQN